VPERINEQWCAPDLQAVILQVYRDAIREVLELKNIQRVEPDPALFEIPRDCRKNLSALVEAGSPVTRAAPCEESRIAFNQKSAGMGCSQR
jgi:hypothetical protein